MMTLFDDEQILKAYAKDIEDNKERETERKTAERMIKMGKLSLDEILLCVPALSLDELKELEAKVMQLVQTSKIDIKIIAKKRMEQKSMRFLRGNEDVYKERFLIFYLNYKTAKEIFAVIISFSKRL